MILCLLLLLTPILVNEQFTQEHMAEHLVFDVLLEQVCDEWFIGAALRSNQVLNNLVSKNILTLAR